MTAMKPAAILSHPAWWILPDLVNGGTIGFVWGFAVMALTAVPAMYLMQRPVAKAIVEG